MKNLLLAFLLVFMFTGVASAGWLSGYTYRTKVTVTNPADRYKISLTSGELDFTKAEADGEDIRFTLSDGITLVDYWFETYDSSAQTADIWIEDTSNDTTLYLYYGDSSASYVSNMDDTFTDFHDDFGVWKRYGTVIDTVGGISDGAGEPSLLFEGSPQVIADTGQTVFKMWYGTIFDTTGSGITYAESNDGKTWTTHANNVLTNLDNYARQHVLKVDSTYYMYVTELVNQTDVDLFTSPDGINWTLDTSTVLTVGAGGAWDDANIGNFYVWKEATNDWRMIYEGKGTVWALGYATATSPGGAWTKSGSNPVISETGSRGSPFIKKIGSTYYLWCHGTATGGLPTDLYKYSSTNLTSWTAIPSTDTTTMARYGADEGEGSAVGQIADPNLIEFKGRSYLFYTANDDGSGTSSIVKLAIADMDLNTLSTSNEDNLDTTNNWTTHFVSSGAARVNDSNAIIDAPTTDDIAIIKGKTSYGAGKTIEFRVRTLDSIDNNFTRAGLSTDVDSTLSNQISIWTYHANDADGAAYGITYHNTTAGTQISEANKSSTVFRNYKIERINSNSTKFYVDDSLIDGGEITDQIPDEDLPAWFFHEVNVNGIGKSEIEWVFIRPYNSTEPTVLFGSEEVSPALIHKLYFPCARPYPC